MTTDLNPLSKEAQLARSPGRENKPCETTGKPKRSCDCKPCVGARSRRKGKNAQREIKKGLERIFGVSAGPTVASTADEENWRLPVRVEAKSGRYAAAVGTFYRLTKAQSDAKKDIGDTRPFIGAARVDGETDPLYVIRGSQLEQLFQEWCR